MIFVPEENTSHIKIPDRKRLRLVGHDNRECLPSDSQNLDKITHDIRSSINIIIGYTQLMLAQTPGKINAQQRRALQDILKSSNRLSELTDIMAGRLDTVSEEDK